MGPSERAKKITRGRFPPNWTGFEPVSRPPGGSGGTHVPPAPEKPAVFGRASGRVLTSRRWGQRLHQRKCSTRGSQSSSWTLSAAGRAATASGRKFGVPRPAGARGPQGPLLKRSQPPGRASGRVLTVRRWGPDAAVNLARRLSVRPSPRPSPWGERGEEPAPREARIRATASRARGRRAPPKNCAGEGAPAQLKKDRN